MKNYSPHPGIYDEAIEEGRPRESWKHFAEWLGERDISELASLKDEVQSAVGDEGVTTSRYDDPTQATAPWKLDPIPMILTAPEWNVIAEGLRQRAVLLNGVLKDTYTEQNLIREGYLPPEVILGNPLFLRESFGTRVREDSYLTLYAADLIRGDDGVWRILRDHTQNPAGLGFAIENRIILSKVLEDLLEKQPPRRLTGFLQRLHELFGRLSPRTRKNPIVALLTPGPFNEAYSEHAFLAKLLGYELVQGSDLKVEKDHLRLIESPGAAPVDVLLRRVDDSFCDPVELRGDSVVGIPGFVNVARQGNVHVANCLGSGVVESPAFLPYLASAARLKFGTDLMLPSVQTWWMGDDEVREKVLSDLGKYRVLSAAGFAPPSGTPEEIASAVRFQPYAYCAQERPRCATAPCLTESGVVPRRVVMRCFLAGDGNDYAVLPGALGWSLLEDEPVELLLQGRGMSKDVWILPDSNQGPRREAFEVLSSPSRPKADQLSHRTGENFFWLGRYSERAEQSVRLFRTVLSRLCVDEEGVGGMTLLTELIGSVGLVDSDELDKHKRSPVMLENFLLENIFESVSFSSLKSSVGAIQYNANGLRDRISDDMWRMLQGVTREYNDFPGGRRRHLGSVLSMCDRLIIALAAFFGAASDSMSRGTSWRLIDLGRRIERAVFISRLLLIPLVDQADEEENILRTILQIDDSTISFRNRFGSEPGFEEVMELLVREETNPRSLSFQVSRIFDHLVVLSDKLGADLASANAALELSHFVREADFALWGRADEQGHRFQMERELGGVLTGLIDLGMQVDRTLTTFQEQAVYLGPHAVEQAQ